MQIQQYQEMLSMMTGVSHTLRLKVSGQLQWGEIEKKNLKDTTSFNYDTTSTIIKLLTRQIQ